MNAAKYLIFNKPRLLFLFSTLILFLLALGNSRLEKDFSIRLWFAQNDPNVETLNFLEKTFGPNETLILTLEHKSGKSFNSDESFKNLVPIVDRLYQAPHIMKIKYVNGVEAAVKISDEEVDIFPFYDEDENIVRQSFLTDRPELFNGFISSDHSKVFIHLYAKPSFDKSFDFIDTMNFVRSLEGEFKDYKFGYNGFISLVEGFQRVSLNDLSVLLPIAIVIIFIFFLFYFKNFQFSVFTTLLIILNITAVTGISGWLGYPVQSIYIILPVTLFVISIADIIHIVSSYISATGESDNKLASTIEKNFNTTLLTSITTSIGFLSFLTSDLVPIYEMGILCAIGSIFTWITTYTMLLPVMRVFPNLILIKREESYLQKKLRVERLFFKRWLWHIPFLIITLTALYLGLQNEVNTTAKNYFSKNTRMSKDAKVLTDTLGGSESIELIFDSGIQGGVKNINFFKKYLIFEDYLHTSNIAKNIFSASRSLRETSKAILDRSLSQIDDSSQLASLIFSSQLMTNEMNSLSEFISIDERYMRISMIWDVNGSKESRIMSKRLVSKAIELGLHLQISGKQYLYYQMTDYVSSTFIKSMTLVITSIFVIFLITFRSISIAAIALIPNVIPLIIGFGAMYLMGYEIDITTVMIGSVTFGIAVDDTIHFVFHYIKELKKGRSVNESLDNVIYSISPALIITSLILISGFFIFQFSDFMPNRNFGVTGGIVIGLAIIVDIFWLPLFLKYIPTGSINEVMNDNR